MTNVIHIGQISPVFVVRDLTKALKYYIGTLGFRIVSKTDSGLPFATTDRDGFQLLLTEERAGRNRAGNGRCIAVVNGLDSLHEELKSFDANFVEPMREFAPGKRILLIRDEDDNRIGFVEDSQNIFMDLTEISEVRE